MYLRCAVIAREGCFCVRMNHLPLIVLKSAAVYDDDVICAALHVPERAIAAARRSGILRFARCGSRVLYLGAWILDWLDRSGVVRHATKTEEGAR